MTTIYNEQVKEQFLDMFPENSQTIYRRIFLKSFNTEKQLSKDLYDFNKEELESFLHDLTPLTPAASESNGRIITSYISWCIDKYIKKHQFNPLKAVDNTWFKQFVDTTVKLYFSESEIRDVESFCENAQDAVIIRLYFEGVAGNDSCELRNLHKNDIDFTNNILSLRDEDGHIHRTLEVSDYTIRLIDESLNQKTYAKKNGYMEDSSGFVRAYTDLLENDFVLRNSATKSDNYNGAVQSSVIYRRLKTISETLSIPFFTGKNIMRSGIINYAFQLLSKDNTDELTRDHYLEIADRYNVNNVYAMKEYCNMRYINELYVDKSESRA